MAYSLDFLTNVASTNILFFFSFRPLQPGKGQEFLEGSQVD
jgi:hypothetical protein